MIKIEFNDQIISVPDGWDEVRLAEYEKWFMHSMDDKIEYVRLVADICKLDSEYLLNSPRQLFDTIVNAIGFIFEPNFEPSHKVNIDGKDYYISLGDKLTLGEWIDIEQVQNSDSESKISDILAIVCRPAGEDYDVETTMKRKDLFRNLTCDKAMPVLAFFLDRRKKSEAILSHYSQVVDQANQFLKDTKTFVINGGGIKQLPIWQRIRYIYLTKSLEKQLSKFSAFSSTD